MRSPGITGILRFSAEKARPLYTGRPPTTFVLRRAGFFVMGWSRHRALFPDSRVRQRLVGCFALTVTLGLIAFAIEVRLMLLRYETRKGSITDDITTSASRRPE